MFPIPLQGIVDRLMQQADASRGGSFTEEQAKPSTSQEVVRKLAKHGLRQLTADGMLSRTVVRTFLLARGDTSVSVEDMETMRRCG
jgi:hypothetical protein